MKQLNLLLLAVLFSTVAFSQEDSTKTKKADTMRIGNIVIIKKGKGMIDEKSMDEMNRKNFERKQKSRVNTNWFVVDLGFANYDDRTNYGNTGNFLVNNPAPGTPALSQSDFKLRAGKSVNVNVWLFMQQVNLIKKNVSIKYGLGVELNNYRYKSTISYKEGGALPYNLGITNAPYIFRDSITFSKNKLALDYLTVPFMLNFSTTPKYKRHGLSLGFGVSAGYLYSQRNKQRSNARGKLKNNGDYDIEKFKFSYIAELGVGPMRFYGSFSPKSMYERSMDIRPYTFGFRFGYW